MTCFYNFRNSFLLLLLKLKRILVHAFQFDCMSLSPYLYNSVLSSSLICTARVLQLSQRLICAQVMIDRGHALGVTVRVNKREI